MDFNGYHVRTARVVEFYPRIVLAHVVGQRADVIAQYLVYPHLREGRQDFVDRIDLAGRVMSRSIRGPVSYPGVILGRVDELERRAVPVNRFRPGKVIAVSHFVDGSPQKPSGGHLKPQSLPAV